MKKKYIIVLITVISVLSIVVPFVINESYMGNKGYVTLWEAKDVLSYFGSILGALGTIFIGIIALFQSEQANKISDRLLQLEESNNTPFLNIDTTNCRIDTFRINEIDISIYFRNTTDNVINIIKVDDLKVNNGFSAPKNYKIPFCKTWTKHYSVLPNQSRQMNFYGASKKNETPLIDFADDLESVGYIQLQCELCIILGYANSNDTFSQTYEFIVNMVYSKENRKLFTVFDGIENSIKGDVG